MFVTLCCRYEGQGWSFIISLSGHRHLAAVAGSWCSHGFRQDWILTFHHRMFLWDQQPWFFLTSVKKKKKKVEHSSYAPTPPYLGASSCQSILRVFCVCSATWRVSLLGKVWVLFLYPCWCKNRSLHCSPRVTGGRLRRAERGLWREGVSGCYSSLPHTDLRRRIWKSRGFPFPVIRWT